MEHFIALPGDAAVDDEPGAIADNATLLGSGTSACVEGSDVTIPSQEMGNSHVDKMEKRKRQDASAGTVEPQDMKALKQPSHVESWLAQLRFILVSVLISIACHPPMVGK